jgi:hypothetical protein
VIIQLRAWERRAGIHFRITLYGLAPCSQDSLAPPAQVRSKRQQMCIDIGIHRSIRETAKHV